ncbi:hypothetical protein ACFPN1_16230 [Lysobacter yangpyeongensis]|uniref:MAE-28990/MAE-18760-like HEPN domain-containing protein n=1 Tax=Lysobacter yangpyeongensis TaxID=346182 RepID=A0ABW0SRR7_9GAMM
MNLNLAALLGRINRSLEEASRFVSLALSKGSDTQTAEIAPFSIQFNSGLSWSREEENLAWRHWILKNGFRDIAELISVVLEEAHQVLTFYALIDRQTAGETLNAAALAARDRDISRFHRLSLSDKLEWLLAQPDFSIPDEKIEEIKSINAARNCLGHRSGIVGERDKTHENMLIVKWLGLDTAVEVEGVEIPFEPPMYLEKGGTVITRLVRRTKEFQLGDRITFDEREFSEIAWTIFAFAQAVTSALESAGKARGITFTEAQV